jgi:hypothetical protein
MNPEQIPQNGGAPEEFILGPPADPASASERFYAGALRRVRIAIVVLGIAGFAIFSWWNFQSLVWAVSGLTARIVEQHQPASGGSIVLRFILRIPLVALAGYAIFISSPGSLRGFLVGLCVPIAAILWEAGYEAFAALRRGF